jgi:DNA-binding transcriptional LysR family regulator
VQPAVALQASAPEAVIDLARRGLGVAVLSESMTARPDPGLVSVPLTDVPIPAVLALVWQPAPNRALQELLRHCRASFTGRGDGSS